MCCADAGRNASPREHAGEDKGRAAETARAGDRQVSRDLFLAEMSEPPAKEDETKRGNPSARPTGIRTPRGSTLA